MSIEGLQLTLPAKAENVAVVRHAVAGLAEAVGMEPSQVADLKTVVTEACMNVVIHAYEGEIGPLEVEAVPEADALLIKVRDRGAGIRPRADADRQSLRLGLPLIAALSSGFGISGGPGRGTEVTMTMTLSAKDTRMAPAALALEDGTKMAMPAGELVGPVLTRIISILAARADFSVDRLSDAVLLGDAISAQGPADFRDGKARVVVEDEDGALEVRVGPLASGAARRFVGGMRIPELDASLEGLADEVRVDEEGETEHLVLRIGN